MAMWNNQMVWHLFFYSHASYCVAGVTLASARGMAGLSPTQWFFTRTHPSPASKLPGHFEAVLEADGHGLKSCQVSRQSAFSISKSHQNPIMVPGSYESYEPWLSFTPQGGLKYLKEDPMAWDIYGMAIHVHGKMTTTGFWATPTAIERHWRARRFCLQTPPSSMPRLRHWKNGRVLNGKKRRTNLRPARPFLIHMMTAHPTLKFIFQRDLVAMSVPHPLSLLKILEACADLDYSSRCSNV